MALQLFSATLSQCFSTCRHRRRQSSSPEHGSTIQPNQPPLCSRRSAAVATLVVTSFLAKETITCSLPAYSFDFRITVPDQTPEEAYAGIREHANDLLEIKYFLDLQSWREAQAALRKSSPFLKQDLYTIIQVRPVSQRPVLRKLYSNLFNNVSRLDYAARDGDATRAEECYGNIVAAIEEMFRMI